MARQYIDPQPFKDRIAELENENQQLKAELDAAKAGESVAGEADLKEKLKAAEEAIGAAEASLGADSQVGITEPSVEGPSQPTNSSTDSGNASETQEKSPSETASE